MKLTKPIQIAIVALTVFNVFALSLDWYHTKPWVDIPSHIVFGVLVGLVILSFHPRLKSFENWGLLAVLEILFWGLAVGSVWEIMEYTRDVVYALPRQIPIAQQGTRDTLGDVANNILGIGAVVLVHKLRAKNHSTSQAKTRLHL
ncbi:hypothetical protein C4571_01725 [Candidatus Parcubacteria bacterium]|nr:MAG: hypothetical protein C4571_01725 [Candidatus Parcubacteria bacterium]